MFDQVTLRKAAAIERGAGSRAERYPNAVTISPDLCPAAGVHDLEARTVYHRPPSGDLPTFDKVDYFASPDSVVQCIVSTRTFRPIDREYNPSFGRPAPLPFWAYNEMFEQAVDELSQPLGPAVELVAPPEDVWGDPRGVVVRRGRWENAGTRATAKLLRTPDGYGEVRSVVYWVP